MSAADTTLLRARAVRAAADALVDAVAERAARTPREAAEAAYYPGHPLGSVEAIEAEIVRRRTADAAPHRAAA
ncbi:hypothetical protein [Streptomyces flaveolus]|jgi:hypothetical protein|uniref:hypothetical protein n=1 Tax=Streptomyces flaveolus TaxID=67297 RepID=UPI00167016FB|nr:hypothetical protein [Streptomyces flaveolus]GGQ80965.1 hypothetical protein GCM10010216_48500 [Streptomyces flaveolus]